MGYGPLGQGRASAYQVHDVYHDDLVGRNPLHHEAIRQDVRRKKRHLYSMSETTWASLDVALWDIKRKAAGMPIAVVLGLARDAVPLYKTYPPHLIEMPQEIERAVETCKGEGYSGFKMQPLGGPRKGIPRLPAARVSAGLDSPLMVDCSSALNYVCALEIGRELDDLGFTWFEEQIRTPVIAGETVYLDELHGFVTSGAVDLVRGDVHRMAGITGLRKAIEMSELFGIELEIHTAASPILDVANLHVACSTESGRFLESHYDMFRFGLQGDPLAVRPRCRNRLGLERGPHCRDHQRTDGVRIA